jgi:K+-transporting ATPase ATPase A chain
MTANQVLQLTVYMVVLLALVKPLGAYMARVYSGERLWVDDFLKPVERLIYRLTGVRAEAEMGWRTYATAMLAFNIVGLLVLFGIQRLQGFLPLNPQGFGGVKPDLAYNTASSFASNTNWQAYGGESTLSYLTDTFGLTVQNFLSAATGMAVLIALIRGLARRSAATVGNFWVDMTRTVLYVLLPLAFVLALVLISQGVVQNWSDYRVAHTIGTDVAQVLPMGPAASQVAIKQLGTNGGGFFNVNSAHPFENPTAISNFFELLAILLIPAALCYTFGKLVGDTRQGWAILAAMTVVFVVLLGVAVRAEQHGNPLFPASVDQVASSTQAGGNMEGKEVRFGITNSALWATATSAASNGSVNSMHDSYTPLGGFVPLFLIQLGEVIYGGVGSGLYGMLVFAIIAVFFAGLMIGRTPEYLGKKIGPYEMKMASLVILIPPVVVLVTTAIAVVTRSGVASMQDSGPHGFSEALYAFSSQGNNNGSAFAGFNANTYLVNTLGGLAMLIARYWLAIPVLAIAGSLAGKNAVEPGPGTLPTHTPLFVVMLVGVVLLIGALTFIPALALGPIVEQLLMHAGKVAG